ncbi:MAG: hypothetical protein H7Y59_17660 [Anaerolineales bacterium]|nr:hypothetical protein [Anaerolineales bacterium]
MTFLKNISNHTKWIALFSIWILHGLTTFFQFQAVSLNENSLPYSVVRVFLLAWIIINFILIILVSKNASLWLTLQNILVRPKTKDGFLIGASSLFFLRVCLWIFQRLLFQPLTQQVGGYLSLLRPVLDLAGYISLEIIILIFFINFHVYLEYKNAFQKFIFSAVVVFAILGVITVIISITGLGILSNYRGDWQRGLPAIALLEWQILLACIFCLVMFLVESKKKIIEIRHLELWICIVIWLSASMLWLSQPVIPNASALKPHEPNFEIYPFNDAQTYDEFAQSALVGNGFGDNRIPQRPLYIVFLIFSHMLVGQDYNNIIFFQTLVFAIFPVLLYLFGREFFSRPIGISIALLAILRDYTSNFVSPFTGNLSYSKLYLSEIPTAILLILFLLIGIRWIKTGLPIFSGFLLGGILGCAMLIRTQVIVALPVVILFAFLFQPKEIKPLIKNILLMLVTTAFVITPWLWRNWNLTGEFIFDSPESQTANLALRYSRLNGVEVEILPLSGESSAEYNARLNQIAKDAITSNPLGAAWGISNTFLNHGVNNILLFPLRNELHNINELWIPTNAFWQKWEGTPNFSQSILIGFYIFLFGLGLTTAWIRNSWLGLLPLTLNLIYNLWTSLALLSGQRFMLTMDWSIYLYYMIGLFTLFSGFLFALESGRSMMVEWVKENSHVMPAPAITVQWQKYLMFGLIFFGIGLSLPISERIFSDKYPLLPQNELIAELLASSSLDQLGFNSACLQKLADSKALGLIQGRAIYPRYYAAGDGERFTDSVGYKVVDEGRLVFNLVGQVNRRYIFKTSYPPDFFPHASDVTLISSESGEFWFVHVKQGEYERFYISESFDLSVCQ